MSSETNANRWRVLVVLCIAVLIVVIDNTIVNVALPSLSKDLHASNSALQWIVDGYALPFAGLLLAGGGLADRIGRKRVIMAGLFFFAVFSTMAAFSTSTSSLLTARALMGAAAAFIFPATLATLTVVFTDADERAKAFGAWGATSGLAIALGPIAGGELITHFWFGSIFLVNVPLVLIAIIAIYLFVPESKSPEQRRLDLVGLFLGTSGTTALVLAVIQGPSWGWLSAATLALFVGSALLLGAFVLYESRRDGPMLDVRVFTNRAFSAGALSIAINFFCLFGFIFLVTQFFQLVLGFSALSAGVRTLPFAIVVGVLTPISAIVSIKFGSRIVVAAGLLITAIAMLWMNLITATSSYFGPIIGSMIVMAIGFSLVNAPSTAVVMETLTPAQVGAGSAVNETTREIGGTLGVAVVGSVFSSIFGPDIRKILLPFHAHGLSLHNINIAQSSMQASKIVVGHFPAALQPHLNTAINGAFVSGFHKGCLVIAGVALVMAGLSLRYLPAHKGKNGH